VDIAASPLAYRVPIFHHRDGIMFKTIACTLILFSSAALAAGQPAPPAAFARLVPTALPNGLQLVEVRKRCEDCTPWRLVDFRSNASPAPIRQERVSVHEGVTAMYAFPGTQYFANTKVEQSILGRYDQDKAIVTEALAHECARMGERVTEYVAQHPEVREKLDRAVATGKAYVEFEQGKYRGVEYASCTQNALGLMGATISQLQVYVPASDVIVTAYLLAQKQAKFRTIEEFLQLRRAFLEGYIDFILLPAGGG
jgi:hypothetical protein